MISAKQMIIVNNNQFDEPSTSQLQTYKFLFSWKVIGVYLILLIWTPFFPMRPFPPFRLDDIWLVSIFISQVLSTRSLGKLPNRNLAALLLLLTIISALSTVINSINSSLTLKITDFYESALFVRILMLSMVTARIHWSIEAMRKLFILFVVTTSLQFIPIAIQYYGIEPLNKWFMVLNGCLEGDTSYNRLVTSRIPVHIRPIGSIGNPNYLSFFLACNVGLATTLFLSNRKRTLLDYMSVSYLAIIFISTFIVFFATTSRSGILAIFLAVIFLLLWTRLLICKCDIRMVCVLLAVILPIISSMVIKMPERMTLLKDLSSGKGITAERLSLWSKKINKLKETPRYFMTGVGSSDIDRVVTDNGYLRMIYQNGIFGLLTYLILLIWAIRRGLCLAIKNTAVSMKMLTLGLASCILIAVFANFFSDAFNNPKFGVFTATIIAMLQIEPKDVKQTA